MCRMCEGSSLSEVLSIDATHIAVDGYVLIGVQGDPDEGVRPWVYTVGLLDAAAHPEVIVAGPEAQTSARVLNAVAARVLAGDRFGVGDSFPTERGDARFAEVHPVQYELGTFNMWFEQRHFGSIAAPSLSAFQLVLPGTFFCLCHQDAQPNLADPSARVDDPRGRPNRAERRRRRPR